MTKYRQLDGRALQLLSDACKAADILRVAERLGYARPSVSMALRGKYIGNTTRMAARIFEVFADRVSCPFLDRDIPPADCRQHREAPIPSGPRSAIDHWRACRHCVFNPANALQSQPSEMEAANG
jgi:hypothetical protein